ncbi:hypothetical protein [Halocola ammonii]
MAIPIALDVSSYRIIPQSDNSFVIVLRFADGDKLGEHTYHAKEVKRSAIPKKVLGMWQYQDEADSYQFVCIDPKYRR